MIEQDYQIVIDCIGQPYLDAEKRLIVQGKTAAHFLQKKLALVDGQSRRVIRVILEWLGGNPTFTDVMDYFNQASLRAAKTAMRVPPAEGVATYLLQNFGNTVAELLGVYLLKLVEVWPVWQTTAVLLYLGKLDAASTAETLIEFIVSTTDSDYREVAMEALLAIGDTSVIEKIDARLEELQLPRSSLQQVSELIRDKLEQ